MLTLYQKLKPLIILTFLYASALTETPSPHNQAERNFAALCFHLPMAQETDKSGKKHHFINTILHMAEHRIKTSHISSALFLLVSLGVACILSIANCPKGMKMTLFSPLVIMNYCSVTRHSRVPRAMDLLGPLLGHFLVGISGDMLFRKVTRAAQKLLEGFSKEDVAAWR